MKCWLCEQLGFAPGEIKKDISGDATCIYCSARISMTVNLIHAVSAFQQNMQLTPRGRGRIARSRVCKIKKVLPAKSGLRNY